MAKAESVNCAVCARSRPAEKCHIFVVTEEERKALQAMGEKDPPARYAYCGSCFKTLSNPETALQLAKGAVEHVLRRSGAANPERASEKFRQALANKIQKPNV